MTNITEFNGLNMILCVFPKNRVFYKLNYRIIYLLCIFFYIQKVENLKKHKKRYLNYQICQNLLFFEYV
jgi:hypothetical protein